MKHIVLLPGMDGTGILFEPLIQALSSKVHPHIIDYPVDEALDYDQLADYVSTKLPTNVAYTLIAESFSGPVGYEIACSPPPNLKHLVFAASFISRPNWLCGMAAHLPLGTMPLPSLIVKHYLLGDGENRPLLKRFRRVLSCVEPHILKYRLQEMARLSCRKEKPQVPCTYILAKDDKLISRKKMEELKSLVPNMALKEIPGPHFILQTQPKACARIIERFIMDIPSQEMGNTDTTQ